MKIYYPAQFDTVRFSSEESPEVRAQRPLRPNREEMLGLIAADRVPVFTAPQMFDGAHVLETVATGDKNADGLLRLIASSSIQMKILPHLVKQRGDGDERFTLINAFVSRLEDDFHFSAWPELADPDAREATLAVLSDRSVNSLTPALARRLDALRRLDKAFRQSAASEVAQTSSLVLGNMVNDCVMQQSEYAFLRGHYKNLKNDRGELRSAPLPKTRTEWYRLIDTYISRQGLPKNYGPINSLRRLVDIQYNRQVADSLGAGSAREDEDRSELTDVFASPQMHMVKHQASLLLDSEASSKWFSWAELNERLGDEQYRLDNEDPAAVLRRVQALVDDGYLAHLDESTAMFFVRRASNALSSVVSRAPAAMVGSAVGGAIQAEPLSIATGAIVGAIVGSALPGVVSEKKINETVKRWGLERHLRNTQRSITVDVEV